MKIIVIPEKVYGRLVFYPGCEFAQMICDILERKCIPENVLSVIEKYGHEIQKIKE